MKCTEVNQQSNDDKTISISAHGVFDENKDYWACDNRWERKVTARDETDAQTKASALLAMDWKTAGVDAPVPPKKKGMGKAGSGENVDPEEFLKVDTSDE